jgi:site-specific DNA-methyltransferase (cytosine-N4-specific)
MTERDNPLSPRLAYTTTKGKAFKGDSRLMVDVKALRAGSVDLIFTSPPFSLTRPKDYGNKPHDEYLNWFESFVPVWKTVMKETGSLVIDVGGSYLPGAPKRSVYHFELAARLARHFDLCQEFYWYNPAKLPGPAQWTNVDRIRVKDSVNLILWFAKDASNTKADNRRVLKRYSNSMNTLLKNGYQIRKRPSNHNITEKFLVNNNGAIPPNLLGFAHGEQGELLGEPFDDLFENIVTVANTISNDNYLAGCRKNGVKPHNARFPKGLPAFFIEFLTERDNVVFDPFAGSNTTGEVAESLGRKWISCELDTEGKFAGTYVRSSAFRFDSVKFEPGFAAQPKVKWISQAKRVKPASSKI